MFYKITCCKDCEDRTVGCHSVCETYILEKSDYDAKVKAEYEEKQKEANYGNYIRSVKHNFKTRQATNGIMRSKR